MQFVEGLNPAQWEALRFIATANRYSRTPGALAEYLGSTKGTVSQTLISLESKGLIARVRNMTDKRRVTLEVTDAGQALIDRDPMHDVVRAAATLETDLSAEVAAGLQNLLEALQRRQGCTKFGICRTCGLYVGAPPSSCAAQPVCGLTGDPIAQNEDNRLCINFSERDASPR